MSKAYVIGHATIKDESKWAEYRSKVPATLEPWGAELIFRGKLLSVLSGEHSHPGALVISFPNAQAIDNWFNSAEYQAIIPLRKAAVDMELMSYEV